jgi:hypothetical protein
VTTRKWTPSRERVRLRFGQWSLTIAFSIYVCGGTFAQKHFLAIFASAKSKTQPNSPELRVCMRQCRGGQNSPQQTPIGPPRPNEKKANHFSPSVDKTTCIPTKFVSALIMQVYGGWDCSSIAQILGWNQKRSLLTSSNTRNYFIVDY